MFLNAVYVFILLGIIYKFKYLSCDPGNTVNKKCDEKEFFNPYVKILRKRGGPPVFQLQSAGFVDLRNQYGVLLCVNGPAYVYSDISVQENVTSKVPTMTFFNGSKFEFYKHQCFLINRPVRFDEDTKPGGAALDNTGVDTEARETFHPVGNDAASLGLLTPKMEVHGVRAYGITLLGAQGNYRHPSMYMFIEPAFGWNDQLLVISTSFVTIGKNAWKAHGNFTNSDLVIKPSAKTDDELCSRPEGTEPFDSVFHRAHYRDDYVWKILSMEETDKLLPITVTTTTTPGTTTTTERPKQEKSNLTAIERIGRIIDPALLGSGFSPNSHPVGGHSTPGDPNNLYIGGSLGGIGGGLGGGLGGIGGVNGTNGTQGGGNGNNTWLSQYEFPEDYDGLPKPFRKYMQEVPTCVPLPNPNSTDLCKNQTIDPLESCKILTSILQLGPPSNNTASNSSFTWKKEILTIVAETFAKLCPLIKKQSVNAVGSVFYATYIEGLHTANASLPTARDARWANLMREMKHCQTEAKPLEFTEVAGEPEEEALSPTVLPLFYIAADENGTALTLTPGNITEENVPADPKNTPPRSLTVKRYDGSQAPLFHYEEAAEADFEFNVAIDFQWKMFSTVLGYCNKLYASKKSSVFPVMLSLFIDDFLNLDQKNWVDPSSNKVFTFFMGEKNTWLDECMEGAYIHSDSEEYRPVRPININGGQHLNHFTKTPPHT